MARHHIDYERDHNEKLTAPKKINLSQFKDLAFGDSICMKDGSLLGIYTEDISGFEVNEKESYKEIIKRDPYFHLYQSGGEHGIESKINIYGIRKVISQEGYALEQGLIDFQGEPAWINFPVNPKLIRAELDNSNSLS